jgi:hypothetical protein
VVSTGSGNSTAAALRNVNIELTAPASATASATASFLVFHALQVPVRPTGIGTSTVGNIATSTMKLILPTAPSTGVGSSSGVMRLSHFLQLTAPTGVGVSSAALGLAGGIPIWSEASNAGYRTQFDPAWFHPSVVHSYTVLLEMTNASMVKSRLYNITDSIAVPGSEVTLTSVMNTPTEVASGALTFPSGEKDYRAEVGTVGGSAGTIYRSRIAHRSS